MESVGCTKVFRMFRESGAWAAVIKEGLLQVALELGREEDRVAPVWTWPRVVAP